MTNLQFNGSQLGQKIRMVLQTLPPDHAVIVAESHADTSALSGILADAVHLQKGMGKANCVGAWNYLTEDEKRRALFLVDCDGEDNSHLLGDKGLIVSEHRDLESDLFLRLRGFEELLVRKLAEQDGSLSSFRASARNCHAFVLELATIVGMIRDLANRRTLPTRIRDEQNGKRRKFGVRDLKNLNSYCRTLEAASFDVVLVEFQMLMGWSEEQTTWIRRDSKNNASKSCRRHDLADCTYCKGRRFANGHELVDLGARVLALRHHQPEQHDNPNFQEFESLLRATVAGGSSAGWPTVDRMRRFEDWSGFSVLRESAAFLGREAQAS
ncbi:hypothetical protein [Arthrobacter sp. NPDC056493]|uniref:hypothetical protein n=1 Tax=Arthrobacter sp. NPDC056493 TaxID=3345839 RepID=UPI00366DE645